VIQVLHLLLGVLAVAIGQVGAMRYAKALRRALST
jgi:hypothetical protein